MDQSRRIEPRWIIIGLLVAAAVVLNKGSMDLSRVFEVMLHFAILFPAIILHEISHGYVAYLLGDPTAKRMGRLTLNPLAHIDPVGTVIMPLVLLFLSGGAFFFGYAKPVPFNPRNFKNERTGMLLTGIAGPVTNVLLAVVFGFASRFFSVPGNVWDPSSFNSIGSLLLYFSFANLMLAFFNLIPIPPLDGSRVVQWLLPDAARDAYHSLERYGFLILVALTWFVPGLFNSYLALTVWPIFSLLTGVS
ncbi:MAG: site-2 protease family protein [Coriobacteriia bacterium]|nr:site-2 protease family protein [Coriobacteriia bacterium]